MKPTGVLLMAYGGPGSLAEVEPYLREVRGGRPTPPALLQATLRRYAHIGGRSPLLAITRLQADTLEACLNQGSDGSPYRVYVGMRHWRPTIAQAVAHMAQDGLEQAVALCLAPQYSEMSVGAYFEQLEAAVQAQKWADAPARFDPIASWHADPGFIRSVGKRLTAALKDLAGAKVIFTAHSLPAASLPAGDPYPVQVQETAALIAQAARLRQDRWEVCYQCAPHGVPAWLGPQLEEVLTRAAREGVRQVVVAPVGFVSDHVETLYDLDVEARHQAEALGLGFTRLPSCNTDPGFITALANLVRLRLSAKEALDTARLERA